MTEYIIDIILVLIFILITIKYFRKGFAKTILNFAAFFVAIILSTVISGKVTEFIFSSTKLFAGMERYIAKLIVFIFAFLILSGLLQWLIIKLNKVFKLPVLKQANRILGGVLGALSAAIAIVVICVCLQVSSHIVYNSKYVSAVESSKIVQLVLSDDKVSSNIKALK